MIFEKIKFNAKHIWSQKNPVRAAAAYALVKLRLSAFLRYRRHGIHIQFRSAGLARFLWEDPSRYLDGEIFLSQILKSGDVFIDVGANIGILSLLASKTVGNAGKVIALEPHPRTFAALKRNLQLNPSMVVEACNLAVGSSAGSLRFSDLVDDDWNKVDSHRGTIFVETTQLDQVCSRLPFVDVLKIDVEGYELPVLQGALQTLKRTECILLECWSRHTSAYGYSPVNLLQLLREFSFHGYLLNEFGSYYTLKPLPDVPVANELENWVFVKHLDWFVNRPSAIVLLPSDH